MADETLPTLVDLNGSEAIVNPDGTPSAYFLQYLFDRGGFLTQAEQQLVALREAELQAGAGLIGGGILKDAPLTFNVGQGTGMVVNPDDIAIDTTAEAERIRDVIGAALVAGTNITITINDAGDTITIASSAAGVPTTRQVIAGAGLTGGGALSADITLNVGAGTGITVNANDIAIDTSAEAERIRDVIGAALVAGTNITITVNDAGDTITIASSGVPTTRQVIAGAGLTGGGDLSADRTFDVGAGTGIIANANDIAIDTTTEAERARDTIGSALVAGSGISITVNDPSDTITINATGGGGTGGAYFSGSSGAIDVVSTTANAIKGIRFTPSVNLTVSAVVALVQATAGGQAHVAQIVECTGTTVGAIVATSSAVNSTGATADQMKFFVSATLVAGQQYALVIENRSGTGATACRLMGGNTMWPNAPGARNLTSVTYNTANSLAGGETFSTVSGAYAIWLEGTF